MSEADARLLAGVDVHLAWIGRRDWKPGTSLAHRSAFPGVLLLHFVTEGDLEIVALGQTWQLSAGDALYLPAGTLRERIATTNGVRWLSVGLHLSLYGQRTLTPFLNVPVRWPFSPDVAEWVTTILSYWQEDEGNIERDVLTNYKPMSASARLIGDGMAKAIFGLCWPNLRSSDSPLHSAPSWLWQVLQTIHESPATTLTELGDAVNISPTHLRRTFHRYLAESPQVYLTKQRLQTARYLLETTEQTVLEIALEVGFSSLSHFTRLFTKRYGVTPARHRHTGHILSNL